jgi:hypothetical protein
MKDEYFDITTPSKWYIPEFAVRNGYRSMLEEILRELGWRYSDVQELSEKAVYHCVPDLPDGKITYQTKAEMRREFILSLCSVTISKLTDNEIEVLAIHLCNRTSLEEGEISIDSCDLEKCIRETNIALTEKNMPDSWPLE